MFGQYSSTMQINQRSATVGQTAPASSIGRRKESANKIGHGASQHMFCKATDVQRRLICDTCEHYSSSMPLHRPVASTGVKCWLMQLAEYTCLNLTNARCRMICDTSIQYKSPLMLYRTAVLTDAERRSIRLAGNMCRKLTDAHLWSICNTC